MSRTLVAFRTHLWNASANMTARRAYACAIGLDFTVLADETTGILNVGPFDKVSHTDNFSAYGLPNYPREHLLWFSCDYALYALRRAKPQYDYYIVSEYDVSCNLDLRLLGDTIEAQALDFVAHEIVEATPAWTWYPGGRLLAEKPMKAFFPFLVISGRAVDYLYRARLEFFERLHDIERTQLPNCETFMPTMLRSMPDYRSAEISTFAALPYYDWHLPLDVADPLCDEVGSLVHPVLSGEHLVRNVIRDCGIEALLQNHQAVRKRLQYTDKHLIAQGVLRAIPSDLGR